jgi:hypothetical protein
MYFDIGILTPILVHADTVLKVIIHSNVAVVDALGAPLFFGPFTALFVIGPTFGHRINGRVVDRIVGVSDTLHGL